jgi:hypothetical protein
MFPQLTEQDIYALSTIQLQPLGTIFYLPTVQGKKGFKYVKFGGTSAITAGKLLVAAAAPANSTGLALPTTNSTLQLSGGSRQILVTNGGTAVTQDQFAGGQIEFLGTNLSGPCAIAGNTADSTGTGTITVQLLEPLTNTTAMANGTNTVNLRQSSAYLPVASTTQSLPVGVTIMPVANSSTVTYFGWVQTSGPAFVFATSATKGYPVVQDTSGTAGYIANTGSNLPQIGIAKESAASSMASVDLQLN